MENENTLREEVLTTLKNELTKKITTNEEEENICTKMVYKEEYEREICQMTKAEYKQPNISITELKLKIDKGLLERAVLNKKLDAINEISKKYFHETK